MQLNDILAHVEDQERGHWFDLADPVTGKATGIRLRIAGPDSPTQARARLRMADELAEAAEDDGRVSAEAREKIRINSLARCVLAWECSEDGAPVPFNHANVVRFLRAAAWVHQAVDGMAGHRNPIKGAE